MSDETNPSLRHSSLPVIREILPHARRSRADLSLAIPQCQIMLLEKTAIVPHSSISTNHLQSASAMQSHLS